MQDFSAGLRIDVRLQNAPKRGTADVRMQQPNNVMEKWVIGHAACDESLRKWAKVGLYSADQAALSR
jgi:hypothetical protein